MKILHGILANSLLYSTLMAAPIAKESGFSGYVSAGVTSVKFKSNMIAGNALDTSISDNNINSLNDKASSESTVIPSFDYNLKYTFADAQTELFLGRGLEDLLTFDDVAKLGVRKNFDGVGIIGASFLFSALPPTVWADPYATTSSRNSVDQTSQGAAITWENIAGSKFDLEMRLRKYEIDGGEQSGLNPPYTGAVDHGLTNLQLNDQLNREGDLKILVATYNWKINKNNHLKPSLRYSDYDLDGQAMQYTRSALKLDYLHTGDNWNFIVTAGVGKDDYDNTNPLLGKEADSTSLGGGFTAAYKNPFGWSKKLSFLATLGTYENDSDIDFYDTSITIANLTALCRF